MSDTAMTLSVVRGALGYIAQAERMLKRVAPNRKDTELSIEEGSEELFKEACELFKATEKFFKFCELKATNDFVKDLKL